MSSSKYCGSFSPVSMRRFRSPPLTTYNFISLIDLTLVRGKGSEIMLELDCQSLDVLIKEIQTDPLKGQPQEIDFQALVSNEKVHSTARVVLVNHEHVIDGILEQVLHEVAFKALPSDLVEQVLVDVGHMHVGDCIKVADLEIAKNPKIDLTTDLEAPVAVVSEFHKVAETEDADADADATAEAAK